MMVKLHVILTFLVVNEASSYYIGLRDIAVQSLNVEESAVGTMFCGSCCYNRAI